MLDFSFCLPTRVLFGKGAQKLIPEQIKKGGFTKVLLHSYDKEDVAKIPIYQEVKEILSGAGIPYVEFLGVRPNPTLSLISEGIELARKEKVDFILAVGGGSEIGRASCRERV